MVVVGWILLASLTLYQWILICRVLLSWVQVMAPQWTPRGAILVIAEGSYTLTDQPLRALRKLIKPLRIGGAHIDIAVIVLFLLVTLSFRVVVWLFF